MGEIKIMDKSYPANLQLLLDQNPDGSWQKDWKIVPVFFLELQHSLMGFFPACFDKEKRIVFTTEKELILEVWKTLSPRRSKLQEVLFYVHKTEPVGYEAEPHYLSKEDCKPDQLLTVEEFKKLLPGDLRWANGLISNDMSPEEFTQTIAAAAV